MITWSGLTLKRSMGLSKRIVVHSLGMLSSALIGVAVAVVVRRGAFTISRTEFGKDKMFDADGDEIQCRGVSRTKRQEAGQESRITDNPN